MKKLLLIIALIALPALAQVRTGSDTVKQNIADDLPILGFNYYYNPTTQAWDRQRGDATNGAYVQLKGSTVDPCMDPNQAKSSKPVTATGQVVALAASQTVYVCGFYATLGGTTPTLKLQYGTGTNCATGPTDLTGVFAPAPNGTEFFLGHGGTVVATASSNALCVVLGGTSPTIAGVLSYVQR